MSQFVSKLLNIGLKLSHININVETQEGAKQYPTAGALQLSHIHMNVETWAFSPTPAQ